MRKGLGFVGIDHHGGHGGRARQQGDGKGHHGDACSRSSIVHFVGIGAGLRRLGVEHVERRGEQKHAAAHLKTGQRDAEELQNFQAQQGAYGDHHKGAEGRYPDRASALLGAKALGIVDKEGHASQRVDDGQNGDEGFEIHGVAFAV